MSVPTQVALRPRYPVRTERLLLRPLTGGDVDALLAYRSRPDVCRYVPFEPMTRQVVVDRISSVWARRELTDEGQSLTLGVEVADTGELVGDVVLFWHSRLHASRRPAPACVPSSPATAACASGEPSPRSPSVRTTSGREG
ncbi:GNAT family N-acetyltransferase [Micromonospora sp. NPDC052213]|uniref:GNAT family N-acetyltransferase n=1 Tax=Micromonospora sp. NPDC052213 TaxID=3155812 RepID=UPI00342EA13E